MEGLVVSAAAATNYISVGVILGTCETTTAGQENDGNLAFAWIIRTVSMIIAVPGEGQWLLSSSIPHTQQSSVDVFINRCFL